MFQHRLLHNSGSIARSQSHFAANVDALIICITDAAAHVDHLARPLTALGIGGDAHGHVSIAAEHDWLEIFCASHSFYPQLAATHVPAHGGGVGAIAGLAVGHKLLDLSFQPGGF